MSRGDPACEGEDLRGDSASTGQEGEQAEWNRSMEERRGAEEGEDEHEQ